MQHGRHRDDPRLAIGSLRWQLQHARQAGPAHDRIPVHEDQFRGQPVFLTLPGKAVDEDLGADERVAPVVIIARRGDDGEIGFHGGNGGLRRMQATRV